MLCPLDCSACRDALCRAEGCRHTGEPMLEICYVCGGLATSWGRVPACDGCRGDARIARPRGPLALD